MKLIITHGSSVTDVGACCAPQVKVADAELLTKWQRKNKEYKQRHQLNAHRESDTMARLMKFRQVLKAPGPKAEHQAKKTASASGAVLLPTPEMTLSCGLF